MSIQIRTKIRFDYSYINKVAIRIGDEDFQVASWGEYSLNEVDYAEMPSTLGQYPINHTKVNKKKDVFQIQLSPTVDIVVTSFKDYVAVQIDEGTKDLFHGALGMMGDFATGNMLARDGVTVIEDPELLAREWQVRPDEDGVIFWEKRYPQYPEKCIAPDSTVVTLGRRLGEVPVSRERAEEACSGWKEDKKSCIQDVMTTGDLEVAENQM